MVDQPGSTNTKKYSIKAKQDKSYYQNYKCWIEKEWRDAYHYNSLKREDIHKRWLGEDVLN